MHSGKIKKLISERGFGFISDSDGRELFFHQSGLVDVKLSDLTESQDVEFEVENSEKGPRAVNVRVAKKA
ncbi:MAG: cold shock domain-containing protein [Candidatus Omnitrophota bacterium]